LKLSGDVEKHRHHELPYVQQKAYGLSSVGKKANTSPENIGRGRYI
jgi:hypothetical protein